ncbi:lipase [Aquipluma nitroreducens]|uniref:Lipase n=2 Tax=Aquipluma nitroreducens TaxID=2010828 RepID=A0A5K7SD82_9BACT|nr:lipase [Aquipluma nitroreducens]
MYLLKKLNLLLMFALISVYVVNAQTPTPQMGIYDGTIGSDHLILVADKADSSLLKGSFVQNRGKAVEESHFFILNTSGSKPIFQSDLYLGKMKNSKISSSGFEGKLTLMNGKRIFIFWRPKVDVSFTQRTEVQVKPTSRYQDEIFPVIEVKSDLLYGKAKGYWTHSPYSNEPYITTLSKGLVKAFNDPELLDLKLDVYYPKTDLFKNRPLVMLIHGGAFYIGSKESACEATLATSLAKRGYLVASIDYRLGFKLMPSDIELSAYRAIQDANAALRFLAHNAKGLGIDPTQVYIGGTSAGAVASLNTAFMKNDERPERILKAGQEGLLGKIEESGNKYTEKFTIKAVVNMWGAVADLNIIDKGENIPVLSIHGTADDIVPFENDYPFRNSLMINQLVMDKMYGSKSIHDRLQILGIRNRLVSLDGLGHEPELATYNTLNNWMDTISNNVSRFLYEETAPEVMLPKNQLAIPENADLKSFYFEVNNGSLVQISATGGVKTKADPTDSSVIWFKNAIKKELIFLTRNKFEAWNTETFPVQIVK